MSTKHALVTGGNRGIGYAITQGLLAQGYEVVITARSIEKAQAAANTLTGNVTSLALDVGDDESIDQAAKVLSQEIDQLDVLINNAGIYPDNNITVLSTTRESLTAGIQTNTFGVIRVVQAMLPLLKKSPDARIINVSSGMGALDSLSPSAPSYALSKLALNGATIMLADALASEGIPVNSMCPGWVRTDMGGSAAPRSPEEGADTAIWLATQAPKTETGKFWRDRQIIDF